MGLGGWFGTFVIYIGCIIMLHHDKCGLTSYTFIYDLCVMLVSRYNASETYAIQSEK